MLQATQYDLVLTDFKMPKMDGLELAEVIKQSFPHMPIILVTAFAEKTGGDMGKEFKEASQKNRLRRLT